MVRTRLQGSSGGEASPLSYPCGSASATPYAPAPALSRTTNCGAVLAGASPTLAALYWRPPPPRCLARAPSCPEVDEGRLETSPRPPPGTQRARGQRMPHVHGQAAESPPFTGKATDGAVRRYHPSTAPRCEDNSKQAGDSSKVSQQVAPGKHPVLGTLASIGRGSH